MAPLIARETPEGGVGRATNSACKLEDLPGSAQQRLGLVGLRQRDHRAVAEVDVDTLAPTALQVVEDESDRRLRRGRRGDQAVTVPDHEDAPALQGDLELRELTAAVRRLALPLG